ncbi:hypothetical protein ACFOGJ_12660 [Marinibaculum pumilum]|uniref:Uncharacterized protein n=1 Tax=Marinibaculum pumilum TaxID=1766165 RepID=A0ABV7L119_9PROT
MAKRIFFVCQPQFSLQSVRCLYSERRRDSLRGDPPRCPTHGAPLLHEPRYDGMAEAEARAAHRKAETEAGRV